MSDYTRVTIVGTERKTDLVLPDDEPITALLPDVLDLIDESQQGAARPVALTTTVGEQLDTSLTLAEQAVRHGTVLRLVPVTSDPLWTLARSIRQRVFVEEQRCPPAEEWDVYDEWDADGAARHVVLFAGGSPAATARWRLVRDTDGGDLVAKFERIAVLPTHRGRGYARVLVGVVVAAAEAAGHVRMRLSAQAHLERFYGAFGFVRSGDDFLEAGIRHVPMARGLT